MSFETRSTFEGLTPADCWSFYDAKYEACTVTCQISKFCIPATNRRIAGQAPVAPPPPPPSPQADPIPEPEPFAYFISALRGKYEVLKNEKSNDKVTVFDVRHRGALYVRIFQALDGGGRVGLQSKGGKMSVVIDSIDMAEKVLVKLV